MHPAEVEKALDSMVLLVDTREQLTDRFKSRLESVGLPWERQKLDFGDYSAKCELVDLSREVVIERKMNLDELALCFGSQRARFEREFERARQAAAKVYLLVENASFDIILSPASYKIHCHSKYSSKSMKASIFAWCARYNMTPIFCNDGNTGQVIKEILYRELKERLKVWDG